jgi:hypothetical protein
MPADASAHHCFNLDRPHFDLAFIERNYDAAEVALAGARRVLDPRPPVQALSLAHMEPKLALMRGQYRRAQVSAQQAVTRADQVQVPDVIASVYRVNCVMAQTYCHEFAAARVVVDRLLRTGHGRHRLIYQTSAAVLDLVEAATRGANLDAPVAAVLAAIERTGSFRAFTYNRPLGAEAMTYALEHDISAVTARRVIETMRFDPPPTLPEVWPWTVRLYLLGAPQVELDGAPLGGKARAQQKPLDLLAAIALGGGAAGHPGAAAGSVVQPGSVATAGSASRADPGADPQSLMRALWPGEDADAKTAFDVTLLRLRKLLVHDGLVLLADGKLRLDRRRVWCDVGVRGASGTDGRGGSVARRDRGRRRGTDQAVSRPAVRRIGRCRGAGLGRDRARAPAQQVPAGDRGVRRPGRGCRRLGRCHRVLRARHPAGHAGRRLLSRADALPPGAGCARQLAACVPPPANCCPSCSACSPLPRPKPCTGPFTADSSAWSVSPQAGRRMGGAQRYPSCLRRRDGYRCAPPILRRHFGRNLRPGKSR